MRFFYHQLAALLIISWMGIGCDDSSLSLAPDNEQPLQSFMEKSTGSKNLLLNSDFTLPTPNVAIHQVESNNACSDLGYTGLYWTEWLPGASFTGVGNVNLFGLIACENIPWLSYGNPQSIPGWMFTNGGEKGLTYRSYFDFYTPSNQIVDLGKGNRLWQEIDNPHGTVVYYIEYAWAATFGSAGEAIVTSASSSRVSSASE